MLHPRPFCNLNDTTRQSEIPLYFRMWMMFSVQLNTGELTCQLQLHLCQSVCKLFRCWPHAAASIYPSAWCGMEKTTNGSVGNASSSHGRHRPKNSKILQHGPVLCSLFATIGRRSSNGQVIRSCLPLKTMAFTGRTHGISLGHTIHEPHFRALKSCSSM